jgi:FKBP-type peptidyl-prolyl cis-trans isomerase
MMANRILRACVLSSSFLLALSACKDKSQSSSTSANDQNSATSAPSHAEVKIEDLKVGVGKEATSGHEVVVHYTGWLTNGTKFDSSVGKAPFTFTLGAGQVIAGWDQGVQGMKVGGKRKLTIPPELGYGAQGAGGVIPPNATLVFEVELLDVK